MTTLDAKKLLEELPLDRLKSMTKLLEIKETRLTFAEDYHLNQRGERMNFKDFPHIRDLYNSTAPVIVLMGSVQSFKMLPDDANVHTPQGWVKNGSLKVGDVVSTPSGVNAHIKGVQKFSNEQLYEFTLDDGRTIESGSDHLWKVLRRTKRKSISSGRKSIQWNTSKNWEILTTAEIIRELEVGKCKFSLPVPVPVEKPFKDLPLNPYFLGLMLGDGELTGNGSDCINIRFSSDDPELLESINDILYPYNIEAVRYKNTSSHYFRRVDVTDSTNSVSWLRDKFKELGLLGTYSHTKFIPDCYKNGSVSQRLAVLQGLMDTDGSGGNGSLSIRLTSERLIQDLQEIVWSLGGVAKYTELETSYTYKDEVKQGKNVYLMQISLPNPKRAFRLTRKRNQVSDTHRRLATLGPIIESFSKTRKVDSTCIVLDDKEHLYIADNYVVTHNSEWVIIDQLACAYSGLSVFYVLPKFETRNTYVQNRINKIVEMVPEYKRIMGSGFFDSMQIKNFGRGTIKYVGSNVKADFREFPGDVLIIDEVDECNSENIGLADDRLRASPYQFKRYLANPSIKQVGIHALFLQSDQREWHVPCTKCGKYCEVSWFDAVVAEVHDKDNNVIDYTLRDTDWKPGCGRDVYMICDICGGPLDRLSQEGRWIPKNPESEIEGYHISMLCARINSISGMWLRFRDGLEDPAKLEKFYNSDLGLPYDAAGNKVSESVLDNCADQDYVFNTYPEYGCIQGDCCEGPCSMGIDVGATYFDVRVSKADSKETRRAVFIGKVKTIDELLDIVDRYNVRVAVIDSMPEFTVAQDFQDMANCEVWLCSYRSEGRDRNLVFGKKERMLHVDRTEALDKSFAALKKRKNVLPKNYRSLIGGQYMNEMCLPIRELKLDDKGNVRYEWSKGKDHQRHCDTYDMLADRLYRDSVIEDCIVG